MADETMKIDGTPKNILSMIMDWPLSRKISLSVVALLSLVIFTFIILQARVADYRLLYANLSDRPGHSCPC